MPPVQCFPFSHCANCTNFSASYGPLNLYQASVDTHPTLCIFRVSLMFYTFSFFCCVSRYFDNISLKHWGKTDIEVNPTVFGLWGLFSCFWGRGASIWSFLSCILPPKDFYPSKQSSVEAEHFLGLDIAKRLVSCCLKNLLYVYFSYSLWQVVCITPWRSAILFYAILHFLSNQLEVQRSTTREPRFSFEQKSQTFTEMLEETCQYCD